MDENIEVLEPEVDSNKKSFLIRDILQQTTESVTNPVFDSTEFVPNERLISWILQNRSQFSEFSQFPILSSSLLETIPEGDSETETFGSVFHEMTKQSMFPQKDSMASLPDSWFSHLPNSLLFYQQLYYYALQNQLTSSIASLDSIIDKAPPTKFQERQITITQNEEVDTPECKQEPKVSSKLSKSSNKAASKHKSDENPSTSPKLTSKSALAREKSLLSLSASARNRRNRTVFSELQLMGLERRFDSQKYLSTPDRADLARALGLTQLQVKTWYQNRRMKWKKQVMQNGCPFPPTKPKGRPKKDSIPTYGIEFTNSILCSIFATGAEGGSADLPNATNRKQSTNNSIVLAPEVISGSLIS